MAMKICPDCGEKYSDTYKSCPFCKELAAMNRKRGIIRKRETHKQGGHRVSQRDPGVLSPLLILTIIVLGLLLVYLLFGDAIGSKDKKPAQSTPSSASISAVISRRSCFDLPSNSWQACWMRRLYSSAVMSGRQNPSHRPM